MPAVYVVFGAAGGIGSALTKRLGAQQGAKVVQVDDAQAGSLKGNSHHADATDFEQVRYTGALGRRTVQAMPPMLIHGGGVM